MIIKRIALYNFRSYDEREFEFSDTVTLIVGPNGAGKTNILEAAYTLLQGKSFRDSDEQLIQYDQEWWKIVGVIEGLERELRYQLGQPSPKQLLINGTTKGRFTYKHQLPVVLFEPDDLLLVHASPGMRRKYIDELLLKIDDSYRHTLAKYERALLQRNNLLKKGLPLGSLRDSVFVWDIALAEYGTQITEKRKEAIDLLNTFLGDTYSSIAGSKQDVRLDYIQTMSSRSDTAAETLARTLEKDVLRGFTSHGPHRDDIDIILNSKHAKQTASRGEVRTLLLALKEIEASMIVNLSGFMPLLLFDDVFSELDTMRQKNLLQNDTYQAIITTTDTFTANNIATITLSR